MKNVYLVNPHPEAYGGTVIVNNIADVFRKNGKEVFVTNSLEGLPKDSIIIPYGIDAAQDMIDKGYNTDVAYLADAITLGYINKIKFYFRSFNVFHYDFFYSIYCLLRDYRIENKILKRFKRIVLVSDTDIEYLKKRALKSTIFYCVPNGVNFCNVEPKLKSNKIRLGILSNWWHTTLAEENGWFIRNYYKKYVKNHHDITLILAGRGSYIKQFKNIPNVEIMGEVGDLNDFFKNVDIFITTNPKGCGILNRVLDAFAYKTCVLGYKNAFTGFRYMKDSYLVFEDYMSFKQSLDILIKDKGRRNTLVNNAYDEITNNNNWDKNITKFMNFVFEENV